MFPGKRRREQLTPDQQNQLDAVVDPALAAYGERLRVEQVPALIAKKLREIKSARHQLGSSLMSNSSSPRISDATKPRAISSAHRLRPRILTWEPTTNRRRSRRISGLN